MDNLDVKWHRDTGSAMLCKLASKSDSFKFFYCRHSEKTWISATVKGGNLCLREYVFHEVPV